MWLLKAPPELSGPSGFLFGNQVIQGHVLLDRWYERDWFAKKGFADVTPDSLKGLYAPPATLLVVRHGGLGDLLMITPLLRAIKKKWPNCKVTFCGVTPFTPILNGNPNIDFYVNTEIITDITRTFPLYDEAFELTHSIEFNATAQIKNNYLHTMELFGMQPEPEASMLPELYLEEWEREEGRKTFRGMGLNSPARFKIGLCLAASSRLRTIPAKNAIAIIDRLAKEPDVDIILYGDTLKGGVTPYTCPKCSHSSYAVMASGIKSMVLTCPTCSAEVPVQAVGQLWPNVHNIGTSLPVRTMAATVGLLDALVTVDTGIMHIAGAWGTPQIILEAAFDGHVTAGMFLNAHVMQKTYPCAPCFRYQHRCQRMAITNSDDAPCMAQFTADEVVGKVREVLNNPSRRSSGPVTFDVDYSKDDLSPRPCPVCGNSKDLTFQSRKGRYAFYECPACVTLFINKHPTNPTEIYSDPLYALAYQDKTVWEGCYTIGSIFEAEAQKVTGFRGLSLLDLGCNNGRVSKPWREQGWTTYGVDCNPEVMKVATEQGVMVPILGDLPNITPTHPKDLPNGLIEVRDGKILARTNSFHAIILSHVLEHLEDPVGLLRKCVKLLVPRGVIWIAMPKYDYGKKGKVSEWQHINNLSAGEHTILFSENALKSTAESLGLLPRAWQEHTRMDSMAALYQKNFVTPLDPNEGA